MSSSVTQTYTQDFVYNCRQLSDPPPGVHKYPGSSGSQIQNKQFKAITFTASREVQRKKPNLDKEHEETNDDHHSRGPRQKQENQKQICKMQEFQGKMDLQPRIPQEYLNCKQARMISEIFQRQQFLVYNAITVFQLSL